MRRLTCTAALLLSFITATASAAPAKLSTITVTPGTITGGASGTGTATLTAAAPRNGVTVTLSSSNAAVAAVPASVFIPQNATSATFSVTTTPVAAQTGVIITGVYSTIATASITVLPPSLQAIAISPATVTAVEGTATGTVTLGSAAPAGGITISLSSTSSAAVIPASVTVAAGGTSASFNITTQQVASQTTAAITATFNGNSRVATLTIDPCMMGIADHDPTFRPTDIVWIDDTLPAGATVGGGTWDTVQKASGSQSLVASGSGAYTMSVSGATSPLTVYPGESLVTYLLTNWCSPPREIVLGWHTTDGQWHRAYMGEALIGGESNYLYWGAINNAAHVWLAQQIPAAQLGLGNKTIDAFEVQAYGGQVWVDRVSKTCVQPMAPAVTLQPADEIWFDDTTPAAQSTYFYWSEAQRATGTKSLPENSQINGLASPFRVYIGDKIVLHALLDYCTPPRDISLRFRTTFGQWVGVYWGEALTAGDGTVFPRAGDLPATGGWVRLEVPASAIGLEERSVDSMWIRTDGGRAYFDAIGRSAIGCAVATAPSPAIPAGDTVVVEDATVAPQQFVNGFWTPDQHASGNRALTCPYSADPHQWMELRDVRIPLSMGENIVFYALFNECAMPQELAVGFTPIDAERRGVYWGTPHGFAQETWNAIYMGPMPAPGVWHRFEIPARLLDYETRTVGLINIDWYGGEAWIDHIGKSGTPCTTARAATPSVPPGDTVWVDDNMPSNVAFTNFEWNTSQSASGTRSLSKSYPASGVRTVGFGVNAPYYTVDAGDSLVVYVLVNECAPPSELMLRWRANNELKGCYWGTPHNLGEGTQYMSMGPMPPPGVWTRIEIPASQLGLEGAQVDAMELIYYDGQAFFDLIGKKTP